MKMPFSCPSERAPIHLRYLDDDCSHNDVPLNKKSAYRGLTWDKRCSAWRVRIALGGKQFHVGRFTCELEAARAFDRAALCLYGEAAKTNFGVAAAKADPLPTSSHILGVRAYLEASAAAAAAGGGQGLTLGRAPSLVVGGPSTPLGRPLGGARMSLDAWRCAGDAGGPPALPQGSCLVSAPPPASVGVSCCLVAPGMAGQAAAPFQQLPVCCPPIQQQQYQPQYQLFDGAMHRGMVVPGPLHSSPPVLMPQAQQPATILPPPYIPSTSSAELAAQLQHMGLLSHSGPPPAVALTGNGWGPSGIAPVANWAAAQQLSPAPAAPQAMGSAAGLALPGPPLLAPCSGPATSAVWAPAASQCSLAAVMLPSGGVALGPPTPPPGLAPGPTTYPGGGALSDAAAAQVLAQAMLTASRSGLLTPHTRVTDLLRLVLPAAPV